MHRHLWRTDVQIQNSMGLDSEWVWSWVTSSREHIHKRCGADGFLNHLFHLYCSWVDYVTYNWSDALSSRHFSLFLSLLMTQEQTVPHAVTGSPLLTKKEPQQIHRRKLRLLLSILLSFLRQLLRVQLYRLHQVPAPQCHQQPGD